MEDKNKYETFISRDGEQEGEFYIGEIECYYKGVKYVLPDMNSTIKISETETIGVKMSDDGEFVESFLDIYLEESVDPTLYTGDKPILTYCKWLKKE